MNVDCCSPQPPKEPEVEAEWADAENDVVHLTETTFEEYIASHNSVLVMFYAPCKYCQEFFSMILMQKKCFASLKELTNVLFSSLFYKENMNLKLNNTK